MTLAYTSLDVPWGQVVLVGDDVGLRYLTLTDRGQEETVLTEAQRLFPKATWKADVRPLRAALRELEQYFAGQRRVFTVPVAPVGTEFQQAVWRALQTIPFGAVRSYGEVARSIGQPRAARAVGGACGRNPIGIIIPCHRVIRTDGTLGGFGGGIEWKEWLLKHEGYL